MGICLGDAWVKRFAGFSYSPVAINHKLVMPWVVCKENTSPVIAIQYNGKFSQD